MNIDNVMLVHYTLVDTIRRLTAAGVPEPDGISIASGGHLSAEWDRESAVVRCSPDGRVALRIRTHDGTWPEIDENAFAKAMMTHRP